MPLVGPGEELVWLALPAVGVSPAQGVVVELDGSAQELIDELGGDHAHTPVEEEVGEAVLGGHLEVVWEEWLQDVEGGVGGVVFGAALLEEWMGARREDLVR